MFLFILESIGTSELILIGIIALIFLGPRKLPQIARTIGKAMADFRNTTNEFKSTWEREVNFQEEADALRSGDLPPASVPSISRSPLDAGVPTNDLSAPEIRPASTETFKSQPAEVSVPQSEPLPHENTLDKKNWL